jgi:glycolate oxidase iron-sulfur subunit
MEGWRWGEMMDLKAYDDLVAKCSHCQFCQATCPVFLEDLLESHGARARMGLIQASLLEGSLPASQRIRDIVDRCLLCTSCTQTCPGGVPVDEIVVAARYQIYGGKRQGTAKRYLMRKIMNNRGFGGLLGKTISLAQKVGWSSKDLPSLASKPFKARYQGIIAPKGKPRAKVAYYVGCATNALYPDTGVDVVRALTHNGIEVVIPDGLVCCGIPALAEGDLDTVQEMIRTNVDILEGQEVDAVVTDCTSCGMMFKVKASKAFPKDDPLLPRLHAVAEKVWEVTDYLNHLGLVAEPSALDEAYTYHVPCHRGWSRTLTDAPRDLLAKVPHARLIEMEEPEKCCGAGGIFFMEFRDLSEDIRSHKLEDIGKTGVRTILTQCPACRSYISAQLVDKTVMHPVSFLARAYGFERVAG